MNSHGWKERFEAAWEKKDKGEVCRLAGELAKAALFRTYGGKASDWADDFAQDIVTNLLGLGTFWGMDSPGRAFSFLWHYISKSVHKGYNGFLTRYFSWFSKRQDWQTWADGRPTPPDEEADSRLTEILVHDLAKRNVGEIEEFEMVWDMILQGYNLEEIRQATGGLNGQSRLRTDRCVVAIRQVAEIYQPDRLARYLLQDVFVS